jgi:NAD(P)-dependent dehydrogenase (short-subunit alcohol dehydrogenase family)
VIVSNVCFIFEKLMMLRKLMEKTMESMFDYTPALAGKTAVITGATSGIGLASAKLFALHGARVIGIGRDVDRCRQAEESIKALCPDAKLSYLMADLSALSQVRRLAKDIRAELLRAGSGCLDVLVNNAGTYSQNKVLTEDGIEKTFAVNHLAPFLLTNSLLPELRQSTAGRVITISSDSHYNMTIDPAAIHDPNFYLGILAYGQSKLANVLFTLEFNRRNIGSTVHAYAVDPGLVRTEIAFKGQPAFSRFIWKIRRSAGVETDVPAGTVLYLSCEPSVQNTRENYWFDRKPKRCSREASDTVMAVKLWNTSMRLCRENG